MSKRSLVFLFIGLVSLFLMFFQPYKLVVVLGPSMEPTYKSGQLLISKKSSKYSVGDIIVVKTEEGLIIKRIIFVEGQIYYNRLNNQKKEIELIYGPVLYDQLMNVHKEYPIYSIKIPKNQYYVLGDNWNNSEDSRTFGTITKDQILYKVIE
jgi:signal peptidase I